MKLKFTLLLLTSLFTTVVYSQPLNDSLKTLNEKVSILEKQVDFTNTNFSNTNSSIGNLIMAVSAGLVIGGLILGAYINAKVEQIRQIKTTNQELQESVQDILKQTLDVKKEVETLSDKIKNNIQQLYKDLQNEEVRTLIEGLKREPEKFDEYYANLRYRQTIPDIYFKDLKNIILELDIEYKTLMFNVILKHFGVDKILQNEELLIIALEDFDGMELSDKDLYFLIDRFAEKTQANLITPIQSDLMRAICSKAEQTYFGEVNPYYEIIKEKFGQSYLDKNVKLYITSANLPDLVSGTFNWAKAENWGLETTYEWFMNGIKQQKKYSAIDVFEPFSEIYKKFREENPFI